MKQVGILALVWVFSTYEAAAQLIKVDQEVFGMDCAPCAYGLERGLKKMDGLEKVQVSLNEGKAYIDLALENTLTLQQIQESVKNNGFSARKAEVILQGELLRKGNGWQINVDDEVFRVAADTDNHITSSLKPGSIKLKGLIKDEEDNQLDGQWEITVTKLFLKST
uniref:Heavy metal-associated domain-containing protein n=1 Tax=Roseihalotalea indica TaxID=2867963 RepID=A0AA49GS92_9BACT|nr:heavy metal-associated domain-containing protein [Tunicatimonas sp. TK19036]